MSEQSNIKIYVVPLVLLLGGLGLYGWWSGFESQPAPLKSSDDAVARIWDLPDPESVEVPPFKPKPSASKGEIDPDDPLGDKNCPFRKDVCDGLMAYRDAVLHWLDTGGWTDERQEKFLVLKRPFDEDTCIREKIEGTNDYVCWNHLHYAPQHLYSNEMLEELIDTDPVATVILADRTMRSGDTKKGAAMYLRAAKMTGKPGPLVRFAYSNGAFDLPGESMAYEYANYVQPIEFQVTTYVYSLVADSMGYPLPNGWEVERSMVNANVSPELIHHARTTLHDQLLAYIQDDKIL